MKNQNKFSLIFIIENYFGKNESANRSFQFAHLNFYLFQGMIYRFGIIVRARLQRPLNTQIHTYTHTHRKNIGIGNCTLKKMISYGNQNFDDLSGISVLHQKR